MVSKLIHFLLLKKPRKNVLSAFNLTLKIKSKKWSHYIKDVFATVDLDFDKRIELSSVQSKRFKITKDIIFPNR